MLNSKALVTQPERVVKQKVPESGVLRACLDLLAAEKIWHLRMNTGAMKVGSRFTRFGRPGTADILAVPLVEHWCVAGQMEQMQPLWIECKSSTGRMTTEQLIFQREVKENGHEYLLVRDVDTLRKWLKTRGVEA